MKVRLPKELRGFLFPKVSTIELNGFDIDLFLPSLFFKILAGGRARARKVNDAQDIPRYIDALAQHPDMDGWEDRFGRRVLERLARTTLIITGGIGRAGRGEQILSTVPYTLLAHKPGLPTEGRRQRGADTFIYHALRDTLGADYLLRQHIRDVFEQGIVIDPQPVLGGRYDGKTELDTLTRLSIAFIDGFDPTSMGRSVERAEPSPCPALTRELGTDLLRYLFAFHEKMPTHALTNYLLALINLELFTYTLKLVYAVNELVRDPEVLPAAMQDEDIPSPPQIYLSTC